jgi:hypothetical protein
MRAVKAGSMQWSKHKVQRISCIENTKLESKGEGNASTFSSASPTPSLLARFRRVSSRVIFTADHAVMPAVTPFFCPGTCQFQTIKKPLCAAPQTLKARPKIPYISRNQGRRQTILLTLAYGPSASSPYILTRICNSWKRSLLI